LDTMLLICRNGRLARSTDLILEVPMRFKIRTKNRVMRGDVFDAIRTNFYDFVYFDPPYGSNNEKMPSSRVRVSILLSSVDQRDFKR